MQTWSILVRSWICFRWVTVSKFLKHAPWDSNGLRSNLQQLHPHQIFNKVLNKLAYYNTFSFYKLLLRLTLIIAKQNVVFNVQGFCSQVFRCDEKVSLAYRCQKNIIPTKRANTKFGIHVQNVNTHFQLSKKFLLFKWLQHTRCYFGQRI